MCVGGLTLVLVHVHSLMADEIKSADVVDSASWSVVVVVVIVCVCLCISLCACVCEREMVGV